ncbi:MAG: TIGR00730 family Rossman fold protein, partial [Eubacterium sp.]
MNICVFGAASSEIDKKYIDAVEIMGESLAKAGHNLVFGAGGQGLMGAAARGFKKGGAS